MERLRKTRRSGSRCRLDPESLLPVSEFKATPRVKSSSWLSRERESTEWLPTERLVSFSYRARRTRELMCATEVLIDPEQMAPRYGMKETWIPQNVISFYQQATGSLPASSAVTVAAPASDEETVDVVRKDGKVEQVVRKIKGPGKGVQEGLGKIGGSRRKALPKKKDA